MSAETTTDLTTAQRVAEGLISSHRHPHADDRLAATVIAGIVAAVVVCAVLAYLVWMW